MTWHFANVWEAVADLVPEAPALACGEARRTWREYDDRASRIASALKAAGIKKGAKAAIYATNCNEYLEAQFGTFKASCCPINVNYRYTEAELIYLFENSDSEAVFFETRFGPRLRAIRDRLPKLKLFVDIPDGTAGCIDDAVDYETLIRSHAPAPRETRSEDDLYMLYTGGTTGMPKGVLLRHGDFSRGFAERSAAGRQLPPPVLLNDWLRLVAQIHAEGTVPTAIPACPLMHGAGCWMGAFSPHLMGGCAVTIRGDHFDPDELWRVAARERATELVIVGDAFAKPLLASLHRARDAGRMPDLSALQKILSTGVMFSHETKRTLLELLDVEIFDGMGSTEGGSLGTSIISRATPVADTGRFVTSPGVKVFNALDREVTPGSDEAGIIGNGGVWAIGYYKDEAKTAATFRVIDGVRYAFPGDFAKVAADGSLILLGRGSACINTGGEKVFPEEVEEAFKAHPGVADCLVVGVPDERFGERVTAVVSLQNGLAIDERTLLDYGRARVAGYKLPKRIVLVDKVERAANGKADYKWAKAVALADSASAQSAVREPVQ